MTRLLLRRLALSLLVLLAMSLVIQALMGLMPGDPIDLMIAGDPRLTPEDAARLKDLYGLNRSWGERWLRWLAQAVQGDLGYSRLYGLPVITALTPALGHTLLLMGTALTLSWLVALPLGLLAARYPGGWLDGGAAALALTSVSLPVFWSGLMLTAVFAVTLGWLPAGGLGPPDATAADRLRHLILPAATLALAGLGPILRHLRAALLTEAQRPYLRTARAKGCGPWRVLLVHQARNALLPVVTLIGLELGGMLSGALVTETVFAWPGMGRLIYESVMGNDFNLALSGLMLATLTTLAGSILADLLQAGLDPRGRR